MYNNRNGKLPECKSCLYYNNDFVPPSRNPRADVVFIGDSPWYEETQQGRVFAGAAGQTLNVIFECTGFDRKEVYLTNTVLCKPPKLGQAHPKSVVELCTSLYLKRELERLRPKLVVPMGNVPLKALGEKKAIGQIRGTLRQVTVDGQTYNAIPTYHPSFLNREPAYNPYAEIDFNAMRYFLDNGHMPPPSTDLDYRSVTTPDEIEAFFAEFEQAKYIAWDTETTGLNYATDDILAMQFSFAEKTGYCMPFFHFPYSPQKIKDMPPKQEGRRLSTTYNTSVIQRLYDFLHNPRKVFFFHNGKFDLRMMDRFFWDSIQRRLSIDRIRWNDTMAMYGLLDENTSKSLKNISRLHTDLQYNPDDVADIKGGQMKKMTLEQMTRYGCCDVDACRRIALKFSRELVRQGLWNIYCKHIASDMKIANVLYKMEQFGAPVDQKELARLKVFMREKLDFYYQRMEKIVGYEFNPNSPPQLCKALFEDLGFPIPEKRTATGKISTDKEVIDGLIEQFPDDPFLINFRFHRNYSSINSTFVVGLEEKLGTDGRVHPDFGFTAMVSGRIACYKPNLANIPREKEYEQGVFVSIRNVFATSSQHKIVYTDAMQIEFKMAAILSGDKDLIRSLFVDREDFHNLTQRSMYPEYDATVARLHDAQKKLANPIASDKIRMQLEQVARSCEVVLTQGRVESKSFNFARMFGAQTKKLAECVGVTEDVIESFLERLAERFPVFEAYLTRIPEQAIEQGYLRMPFGRKRRFPVTPDLYTQLKQAREGSNFLPQSSAAYTIRAVLARTAIAFERVGMSSYPCNQVYDCILIESPNDEMQDAAEIVAREMLTPVPEMGNHVFGIDLGIGRSWRDAEANKVKLYDVSDLPKVKELCAKSLAIMV